MDLGGDWKSAQPERDGAKARGVIANAKEDGAVLAARDFLIAQCVIGSTPRAADKRCAGPCDEMQSAHPSMTPLTAIAEV